MTAFDIALAVLGLILLELLGEAASEADEPPGTPDICDHSAGRFIIVVRTLDTFDPYALKWDTLMVSAQDEPDAHLVTVRRGDTEVNLVSLPLIARVKAD